MELQFVSTDGKWSRAVKTKYGGMCVWPGCCSSFKAGAHHVVSRGNEDLRKCIENGVYLCGRHHRMVERMEENKYLKVMAILIGDARLKALIDYNSSFLAKINKSSVTISNKSSTADDIFN